MSDYTSQLNAIGASADAEIAGLQEALELSLTRYQQLSDENTALKLQITDLTNKLSNTKPADLFSTQLAVGINEAVWEKSTTSSLDTITTVTRTDGKKVFRAKAGNHQPNSSGSTYARYRIKLPEVYGVAPRGWFGMSAKVRLLTNADHYYSFLRTDNYVATLKGTTTKVGCSNGSEWRVGLMMYPGNELRFESTHQNNSTIVLWRGTLAPGAHDVSFTVTPSVDLTGSWSLTIDGTRINGKGQTVPSTVPLAERVVTRAVTCIDGANKWTTKAVEVEIEEALFESAK